MNDSNNNKFDYTSGNYLTRVHFSLIALNRVDNDELLAIDVFSNALYELLYAATVTGIEEYLQERLINEVFASEESKKKYVKTFNHKFHYRSKNQRKNNKEESNKEEKREIFYLEEDDEEGIRYSLFNKQVYHRLDIICDYFTNISNFDVTQCPSWEAMKKIIERRHLIIHHGSRDVNGNRIKLMPYEVNQAYDLANKFIEEVEAAFVKSGGNPLIINPEE